MPLRDHYVQPAQVLEHLDPVHAEARAEALMAALRATDESMRLLIQRLRNTIEIYTNEGAIANVGDTVITPAKFETANLILVNTIIFQGPATGLTTMTLRLGRNISWTFNTRGPFVFVDLKGPLLTPQDERSLTFAGAAAAGNGNEFLTIFGSQLPEVKL